MKKIFAVVALAVAGVAGLVGVSGGAYAGTCPNGAGEYTHSVAECGVNAVSEGEETDLMETVKNILNVVIGAVGVVAVVVMIIGGINFIISQGDAAKIQRARNTILYGLVGLVIAVLSFAIVNFVLKGVFKSSSETPTSLMIESKIA